jgi:hypothetical protein
MALGEHFLYAYRYINEYNYGCIKRALEIAHIGILFWRMVEGLDIAKVKFTDQDRFDHKERLSYIKASIIATR